MSEPKIVNKNAVFVSKSDLRKENVIDLEGFTGTVYYTTEGFFVRDSNSPDPIAFDLAEALAKIHYADAPGFPMFPEKQLFILQQVIGIHPAMKAVSEANGGVNFDDTAASAGNNNEDDADDDDAADDDDNDCVPMGMMVR